MFAQPFEYMTMKSLPEVSQWFMMAWLYLGLPSLLAILIGSFFFNKLKARRGGIFKRLSFRSVAFSMPLAGLLLGGLMGYFAAWTYVGSSQRLNDPWYYAFAILGEPGDAMANSYGGDWQDEEAWNYRSDITLLNGLFWASVATAGVFVVRFTAKLSNTPEQDVSRQPLEPRSTSAVKPASLPQLNLLL